MAIWSLRARIAILWLVITLLVIGVVAWAISAEVVMGAMRDAVRKNSESSTLRLHQSNQANQNFDNSDDFSIHRLNKEQAHSRKSGLRHSETALIHEVNKEETNRANNRPKAVDEFYSYDQRSDDSYNSDSDEGVDQMEEALESIGVMDKKVLSTKRPLSVSFDLEKLRRGLTGAQLAQVIDRLMAQTKNKEGKQPEVVVVAPTAQVSNKKSKNSKTTKISTKSEKYSKSSKMRSTTSTTTTSRPSTTRTTIKPFNRSKIQSLSLKLSNTGITTTKPKRTKLKVNTIKIRRTTTTTTTPSTTTTTARTTTKKSKSVRSRKNPLKPTKINSSKPSTTSTTTESPKTPLDFEIMKQKIRQKELEFILNKVESLEKQQKRFLKHSNQDLLMESSNRENVVKEPKYEVISFRQKYPEHNPSYSSRHNYDIQDMTQLRQNSENNWQPTPNHSPPAMHLPPPPPPPPPVPNGPPHPMPPPSNGFFSPENMNIGVHQMPHQSNMGPPPHLPPPPQHFGESQPVPQFHNKPPPELNMHPIMSGGHPKDNLFNGVLPIPNRGPHISLGGADHQTAQESHPMAYQIKQRGQSIQKSEKPGIQLSFGGGPMGGGGQLKTSPMGIFKTLLLPLLPKPRMNLNGKVVFGVVLENGVGFGKKPKIVAQHFSTGHI